MTSHSKKIGLVGAIASGKSLASDWFRRHGWTVLDADRIAHDLYAPGTELNGLIVEAFGPTVRSPDESIDRRALGAIVFSSRDQMRRLEAMVHPLLRQKLSERVEEGVLHGERVVLEMALLWRWPEMVGTLDLVLGISAAANLRKLRLMARNGLSEEEALSRLAGQEPEADLLSCATTILVNEGSREELEKGLDAVFPA